MDYKKLLTQLLEKINDWESLKVLLEKSYNTSVQKSGKKSTIAGKLFEYFTKYYFICNPLYQNEYKNVWLFDEVPLDIKTKLNINYVDHGIDLLLQDNNNSFIAVQCKFKNDESCKLGWSKDKLANLFGFASSSKIQKLIIFSNASEIDDTSKDRTDNLCFLSIKDLLELDSDFFDNLREYLKNSKKVSHTKKSPRPYQKEIINTVSSYFSENNRGKLILPCGTGKTLISLWIRESLNVNLTLFLVPSLNLIRQTKNEWIKESNTPFDYIIVCSEMDIDKEEDSSNIHLYDLDSFVIDNPIEIKSFIKKETFNKKVIFSTYQSFNKIIAAYDEKLPAIDLAICDEAHRTASIDCGVFSLVHKDTEKMHIAKRLYMTATPRVYSQTIKKNIEETGILLFDMSDETTYGKEIYRMSFAEAIQQNILVDYQIVCLGVADDKLYSLIKKNYYIDQDNSITDYVNNYAVKHAFEKYSIKHAITFHSKLKQAQLFSERNKEICANIKSYFVSGKLPSSKRSIILNAFKNSEKAVVANARCLTEGVDIPSVDAVFFCDPKKSKVDIVQAVGRTLRKDKKNPDKIGKIIIPIYLKKEADIEEEIDTSIFNDVIKIIRSIADHDERLQDEINNIAYKQTNNNPRSSKIQFYYNSESKLNDLLTFENIRKNIETALFTEIISKNSNTWELFYKELQEYLWAHNNNFPINSRLATWCSQQRANYKKGVLSTEKIKKLELLNFTWALQADKWNDNFNLLIQFLKTHNGKWPSQRSTNESEQVLANWMYQIGDDYRDGKLKQERYDKLSSIGYIFEDRKWMTSFEKAKRKIEELGHFPNQDEDKNVYKWLLLQYNQYNSNKEKLKQNRIKCLEEIKINHFQIIDSNKESWNDKFLYLKNYCEEKGTFPNYKDKIGSKNKVDYGPWAHSQITSYKAGKLSNEKINQLESIGFEWIEDGRKKSSEKNWDETFESLKQWLSTHKGSFPNNSSSKDPLEKELIKFINNNRNWNKEDFPKDRKQKLDSIGFARYKNPQKEKLDKQWDENFDKAKEQLKTYGKIPYTVDGKVSPISKWISNQKEQFKKNKLSEERIKQLKEIGIILEN